MRGTTGLLAVTAGALALLAGPSTTGAKTIKVTTTKDEAGTGKKCSLREAVEAANRNRPFGGCRRGKGKDLIRLGKGPYVLTSGDPFAGTSQLTPRGKLTIRGNRSIIDGARRTSVFLVGTGKLKLQGLTVRNGIGDVSGGVAAIGKARVAMKKVTFINNSSAAGGALGLLPQGSKAPKVTVKGSTFSDNDATIGGAIDVAAGRLTLKSTKIGANEADRGGGINIEGTVKMTSTEIISNGSSPDRPGTPVNSGMGGGIYLGGGKLIASRSGITNNGSGSHGGGLYNHGGVAALKDSTVAGNTSFAFGGGIATSNRPGESVNLVNATVYRNIADADRDGFGDGGGIASDVTTLRNTIVADNIDGQTPECVGTLRSAGHNLFFRPQGCGIAGNQSGNRVGDPTLGEGFGFPQGWLPLPGSPALNGARNCSKRDQHGQKRAKKGKVCEIGALDR